MMVAFYNRRAGIAVVALLMMMSTAHLMGQRPAAAATSPEAVAESMWKKILSTCPIQGSGGTATIFAFPISFLSHAATEWRFEYREAWTKLFAKDLTAADKLNGFQFHGLALLSGPMYRIKADGEWSEWKDGVGKKVADTLRPTWEKGSDSPSLHMENLELGVRVIIEERSGRWSFRYVSAGGYGTEFDPDDVAAKKNSCDVLLK